MLHKDILTIEDWNNIPGMVHGFGMRDLSSADIAGDPRFRDFRIVILRQIHSAAVHIIEMPQEEKIEGDSMITGKSGILLTVKTADCLPVLIADTVRRVVAAVHCGWRGTAEEILKHVIRRLEQKFASRPRDMTAAMGPCISGECYEVGPEVLSAHSQFDETGISRPNPLRKGRFLLDIREANRRQLVQAGLGAERIYSIPKCPHCDPGFHSFRRDGEKSGRLLNFIGLFPDVC